MQINIVIFLVLITRIAKIPVAPLKEGTTAGNLLLSGMSLPSYRRRRRRRRLSESINSPKQV